MFKNIRWSRGCRGAFSSLDDRVALPCLFVIASEICLECFGLHLVFGVLQVWAAEGGMLIFTREAYEHDSVVFWVARDTIVGRTPQDALPTTDRM